VQALGCVRHLLRVCLMTLVLVVPRVAWALPANTWVVAIGNNNGDAGETALLFAERDAREFSDALRQHGGVSSERVRMLFDEDAAVVRRAILDASRAARASAEAGTPSALVVFYSGHADAQSLHLRGTQLPVDELRSLVQTSPAGLRLLVIDSCRSGTLTRVKGVTPAETFQIHLEDRAEAEGVAILSSSAAGELSQEADRLRGSFFSHHLVNALRGAADRNGDGRVSLSEAYAYTYAQTVHSSGGTLTMQHPTYSYDLRGRNDVVLTTPGAASRRSGRLRIRRTALYVVHEINEAGPIVAEFQAQRDDAMLALPEGKYFVQQREPSQYVEYTVQLKADEDTDLGQTTARVLKYDELVRKRGAEEPSTAHGVVVMGAGRGATLAGETPSASIVFGYEADLPWVSLSPRVRYGSASIESNDAVLRSQHRELGLGGMVQHYVDLGPLSVAFGIAGEAIYHTQRFDLSNRQTQDRTTWGVGFGAVIAAEKRLYEGLGVRLEGGPAALLMRQGSVRDGRETTRDVGATLTWWLGGGVTWRL
jgi:Caspase domain